MAKQEHTVGVIGLGFGRSHIPAFQVSGCRVVAVCQRNREQAAGHRREIRRGGRVRAVGRPAGEDAAGDRRDRDPATSAQGHRARGVRAGRARALREADRPGRDGRARDPGRGGAGQPHRDDELQLALTRRVPALSRRWCRKASSVGCCTCRSATCSGVSPTRVCPPTWRMDRAQAGHGTMGDAGVHAIDFVRWNFGEIVRVAAPDLDRVSLEARAGRRQVGGRRGHLSVHRRARVRRAGELRREPRRARRERADDGGVRHRRRAPLRAAARPAALVARPAPRHDRPERQLRAGGPEGGACRARREKASCQT